ncbi:GNAT family N-acetyltransferase [Kytococcus sp. HMSC28H12]|uniref:GNAT family N-acetyltransferase n=1 Tax=Kytococcus sp. HMSC28H12 TaxID=1581067 RepID=UPI00352A2035
MARRPPGDAARHPGRVRLPVRRPPRTRPGAVARERRLAGDVHARRGRGGAPVGAARLMEGGDDLPELISMFVAPAHRGTGLSSRIVEAVADRARGRGHAALHLHVMTDNPRARGVYERGGFRCVGAPFRAAPDDPDDLRTEWRMERPLRGAGAGMES